MIISLCYPSEVIYFMFGDIVAFHEIKPLSVQSLSTTVSVVYFKCSGFILS